MVRALGWDKPKMIQRGTSRVFGSTSDGVEITISGVLVK